jgi:anti-sigma B factor antagonist
MSQHRLATFTPDDLRHRATVSQGDADVSTTVRRSDWNGVNVSVTLNAGVVSVAGEVDAANCGQLDDALASVDGSMPAHVDMSAVTFMDSSGLEVLVKHDDIRRLHGVPLEIIAASESVRRLLNITGLDEWLRIRPN